MPYNNPYNRAIASTMDGLNERFAHLYAYSPVDGRGNPYALDGGSTAGVLFQIGNASKRDAEDNVVNDNMNLPPVYYKGNSAEGGNGFAKGTYCDRGDGVQDGASGVYVKGGHRSGDFSVPNDEYRGSGKNAKEMGKMMAEIAKEHHMKGGSFWDDFKQGFNMVFEPAAKYLLKPLGMLTGQPEVTAGLEALGYGKDMKGGAILGNPDPYPVQGNSQRIAGRGRGRPKKVCCACGNKKCKGCAMSGCGMVEPKQGALLAMPAPELANGVPPQEQLRGSYGGAKPSKEEMKVMKAVAKKLKGKGKEEEKEEKKEEKEVKGSGKNARAEIVKKIMKEKGMKLIEASKYVKQHNLYKK